VISTFSGRTDRPSFLDFGQKRLGIDHETTMLNVVWNRGEGIDLTVHIDESHTSHQPIETATSIIR
jgi:hypothetical protein